MDLSKEYIMMCKKAIEIQARWKPRPQDDIYYVKDDYCSFVYTLFKDKYKDYTHRLRDAYIWLPRQDQLQDMILETWEAGLVVNYGISPLHERHHLHPSDSFEKAWLSEVMFSMFDKVWDSDIEDWVSV